jgi:reactive intermediate/imine deaminase
MARQEIMLPQLGEPISHYAHAVRFGDLLFVSGCAPLDEHGELVGRGDVKAQTRQVLANLRATLAAVGLGPADVLKVTVYLTEIEDRPRINPLRRAFFGKTRPASTLVEVSGLAVDGMRVEIEAIAGFSPRGDAPGAGRAAEKSRRG